MKATTCDRCGKHAERPAKDVIHEGSGPMNREDPATLLLPATDTQRMYRKWVSKDLCGKCLDALEKWFRLPMYKEIS